jgi:hypothetical protein
MRIPFNTWYRYNDHFWYITSIKSQYSKRYIGFGYDMNDGKLFINYKLNPGQETGIVYERPLFVKNL